MSFLDKRKRRFDSVKVSPGMLAHYANVLASLPGVALDPEKARFDAGETAFFAKQLEHIKAQTYDVVYADLRAKELIPVAGDTPSGAESVTWRQYDKKGTAKIVSNYSDDFPRATVQGAESTPVIIRSLGASYDYSVQEIRAAMYGNVDLESMKAEAARRAIEEKIDEIAAIGDSTYGLSGFLKLSGPTTLTLPTGTWSSATAAQMLTDLLYMVEKVSENSKGAHTCTHVIVPSVAWRRLNTAHFSTDESRTVLRAFKDATEGKVAITKWARADTAGSGSVERLVAYEKNPRNAFLEIPQDFEQMPPQVKGMSTVINCHARTAGVLVTYPLSIVYADNS